MASFEVASGLEVPDLPTPQARLRVLERHPRESWEHWDEDIQEAWREAWDYTERQVANARLDGAAYSPRWEGYCRRLKVDEAAWGWLELYVGDGMGGYHLPGPGGVLDQEARLLDALAEIAGAIHQAVTPPQTQGGGAADGTLSDD